MAIALTVRLSSTTDLYLMRLMEGSGLSKAAVVETLVDEARRRGWSVEPRRGAVVEEVPDA